MYAVQAQGSQNASGCGVTKRIKLSTAQVSGMIRVQEDPSIRALKYPIARCAPWMRQSGNYYWLLFQE